MENFLQAQKAIVTGGTRGIGFGIAKEFVSYGATVEIWGTNEAAGQEAVNQLMESSKGGEVSFAKVDVTSLSDITGAYTKFIERHGCVDILVNNAGITRDNLLMRVSEKDWMDVIQTNLTSAYYTCSTVIRGMLKARKGSIINVSSIVGLTGNVGQTNYAASKAGLIAFSKSLAKEVGSRNVRVNCIAPGFIQTAMTEVLSEDLKASWVKQTPLSRLGTVEDVAGVALFLASPWSSYVTGQVLTVDGGLVTS